MVNPRTSVPMAIPYPNYNKYANPNAHVRVCNVVVRANGKKSKEYIINAFNYTLRKMVLDWCRSYMSKFPNYIFLN